MSSKRKAWAVKGVARAESTLYLGVRRGKSREKLSSCQGVNVLSVKG